ncbi:hypothetical protein ENBRE01_0259 [Enteropsectra breve]|nr:hypothetical protein ENBRE01_0259 [Enteropsectra breve]
MHKGADSLLKLKQQIKSNGIDQVTYEKLAKALVQEINKPRKGHLLEMLKCFVSYDGKALYVNEIKKHLEEHDAALFNEYAQKFKNNIGCAAAFGIEFEPQHAAQAAPVCEGINDIKPSPKIKTKIEEPHKPAFAKKRKLRVKKNVKKEARQRAIENQLSKIESQKDKKQKRKEFEEMVRREANN